MTELATHILMQPENVPQEYEALRLVLAALFVAKSLPLVLSLDQECKQPT